MALIPNKDINFSGLGDFFKKNIGVVFLVILAVLFVFEIFKLKTSVSLVFGSQEAAPLPVTTQSKQARINFDNYNLVVKRINSAASFEPSGGVNNNPFQSVKQSP